MQRTLGRKRAHKGSFKDGKWLLRLPTAGLALGRVKLVVGLGWYLGR
jgi:hypothetical protein